MKPYETPRIVAVITRKKAEPTREAVRVFAAPREPLMKEPGDMKQYLKRQVADTFPFKRRGFRKTVK